MGNKRTNINISIERTTMKQSQPNQPTLEQLIVACQDLATQQNGILLSIKNNLRQFEKQYVEMETELKALKEKKKK